MYRTDTIDYGIVLAGETRVVLDGGEETTLRADDMIAQNGVLLGWANRSASDAESPFIIADTRRTATLQHLDLAHTFAECHQFRLLLCSYSPAEGSFPSEVLWRKKVWAEQQLAPVPAGAGVTFEEARGRRGGQARPPRGGSRLQRAPLGRDRRDNRAEYAEFGRLDQAAVPLRPVPAAMSGLNVLTTAFAHEFAPRVRVNAILPARCSPTSPTPGRLRPGHTLPARSACPASPRTSPRSPSTWPAPTRATPPADTSASTAASFDGRTPGRQGYRRALIAPVRPAAWVDAAGLPGGGEPRRTSSGTANGSPAGPRP